MDLNTIVSIAAILITVFLFLLSIIGTLMLMQFTGIKKQVSGVGETVTQIQVDLKGVETTLTHHTELLDDQGERVKKVENSVSNTERIGVLELKLANAEKEIDGLRKHWHRINEIMGMVVNKLELNIPASNN